MHSKNRASLFDQWADDYDQSVESHHTFPFEGYERVLDEIVVAAGVTDKILVLDLGTGTGNLAKRFVSAGCTVWATDFSPQMLAQGRVKLPQVHFIEADLLGSWPNELPERFDRIVSAYVLHEFDLATKIKLLKRMAASLADDGRIVIGDIAFLQLVFANKHTSAWQMYGTKRNSIGRQMRP